MGFLIEQFWLLLLLGFLLGLIIGWLLRHWRCIEAHGALEGQVRELEARLYELEHAPAPQAVAAVAAPPEPAPTAAKKPSGPHPYPIEEVEGIGAGFGRKLRAMEIATTLDFLGRAGNETDRDALCEKIGDGHVTERVVNRWASMCDLMRVPGVRGQYAELLEFTSINTVQELAEQEAAPLLERLKEVNERENRVRRLPSRDDVDAWIESASGLEVRLIPSSGLIQAEELAGRVDYPIEEVEGIGKGYGGRLRELGIATTGDLLARGRQSGAASEIADRMQQQGIDSEVVGSWYSMCDLMRVAGIRGQFAELLYFAGVHSVEALAGYRANALLDLLKQTEERENRVPELPRIDEVAEWVAAAKKLLA